MAISELIGLKAFKLLYATVALMLLQTTIPAGDIVAQALEQGLLFGLIIIAIIMLWKEYGKSQDYNKKRDERFEEMMEASTKAIERTNAAIVSLTEIAKSNTQAIENLSQVVREVRQQQ